MGILHDTTTPAVRARKKPSRTPLDTDKTAQEYLVPQIYYSKLKLVRMYTQILMIGEIADGHVTHTRGNTRPMNVFTQTETHHNEQESAV